MSVMRFSAMNIAEQATAEKYDTNMPAEAEQYSYGIVKNWMILSLNILIKTMFL